MHGRDGQAHDHGAGELSEIEDFAGQTETERKQQRDSGDGDGHQHGSGDDGPVVMTFGGQAHRRHADVMHGGNSCAHGQAGYGNRGGAQLLAADGVERDGRSGDGGEQREQHRRQIIKDRTGRSSANIPT